MQKIEPVVTYKVWYKLNPEYDGTFQVDKIGGGGLHATIGPADGGLPKAKEAAGRVKAWFNEEKVAVERSTPQGKKSVEVKTTFHNNVVVWIEKYKDGYPIEELDPCPESTPVPSEPLDATSALIAKLQEQINELKFKLLEKEEAEELAGV